MNESPENSEEKIERTDSENENHQELVPIEIDSDNSEYENDNTKPHIGAFLNSSKFSKLKTENLGTLLRSHNS